MSPRSRLLAEAWDSFRTSFGLPSALAMLAGVVAALALPELDSGIGIDLPVLTFDGPDSARGLLETTATVAVSVAGLSFSVTVVAFTLASSQLSPTVLRSFSADRVSQLTLAALLGTFIYCLVLLVRLGVQGPSAEPPNLSLTIAVLAAIVSFILFAVFVAHIVLMLQPSSVVEAVGDEAEGPLRERFPGEAGEPDDAAAAERALARLEPEQAAFEEVESERSGYLTFVEAEPVIEVAAEAGAVVEQAVEIGEWLLPGQALARVRWVPGSAEEGERDALRDRVRSSFRVGKQRTMVADIGLPVRQLTDIALKGLSPGVNDPTTAENAIDRLAAILVELIRSGSPTPVRVDREGHPRFVARPPTLDGLVRGSFGEVRPFCGDQPRFSERMLELLAHLRREAVRAGAPTEELDRQRELFLAGLGSAGPTDREAEAVRVAASGSRDPSDRN